MLCYIGRKEEPNRNTLAAPFRVSVGQQETAQGWAPTPRTSVTGQDGPAEGRQTWVPSAPAAVSSKGLLPGVQPWGSMPFRKVPSTPPSLCPLEPTRQDRL